MHQYWLTEQVAVLALDFWVQIDQIFVILSRNLP